MLLLICKYLAVVTLGERFEIRLSTNRQFYFVLIAPNNEPIATSEMYKDKDSCKNGINAVRKYAPIAPVEDKTI
jgi:uncharacterized protein YegP (UPF0339 family)